MADDLDMGAEFAKLGVEIDASGAKAGAADVVTALKSIEQASVRVAAIMEQQLANEAEAKLAASARRIAAEQARAAKAAQKAHEDSAKAAGRAFGELAKAAESAMAREQAAARKTAAEIDKITRSVGRLSQETKNIQTSSGGGSGIGGLLGAAAVGGAARGILEVATSYEGLRTALITTTGSASIANSEFAKLQQFAKETPFSTEEAVRAFNHMRAVGLDPTIEKLRTFGDMASTRPDRSFLDFIMAVADGTQGMDRRLKDFGVDLKIQGAKVKLTFGDMAMTVNNNAKSIEEALLKIGAAKFGGAMERQAQTVSGRWSTFKDELSALADAIGQGGLNQALGESIKRLTQLTGKGQEAAKALGEWLGDRVRDVTSAIEWAAEHTDELRIALEALIALKVASWIADMSRALIAFQASNPALLIATLAAITAYENRPKNAPKMFKSEGLQTATEYGIGLASGWGFMPGGKQIFEKAGEQVNEAPTAATMSRDASNAAVHEKPTKKPGDSADGKKKVDQLKESLEDLALAASKARQTMYLLPALDVTNPEDMKRLEVETRLLDWKNKLLDKGVSLDKIKAAEGEARAQIEEAVHYQTAAKAMRSYADALGDLKKEAADADKQLGMVQAGMSDRDRAIEAEMTKYEGQGYTESELANLRTLVAQKIDAQKATEDLTKAEEEYNEALKDRAKAYQNSIQGLQFDIAAKEAQINLYRGGKGPGFDKASYLQEGISKLPAGLDPSQLREAVTLLERSYQLEQDLIALQAKTPIQQMIEQYTTLKSVTQEWGNVAVNAANSFASTLNEALWSGKANWKDFAYSVGKEITQLMIKMAVMAALQAALGLATGGTSFLAMNTAYNATGFIGAQLHDGGTVGRDGTPRAASPAWFVGARRYHGGGWPGLRSDEVPAILQRGERVLSRREVAEGGHSRRRERPMSVTFVLNGVTDADSFRREESRILARLSAARKRLK